MARSAVVKPLSEPVRTPTAVSVSDSLASFPPQAIEQYESPNVDAHAATSNARSRIEKPSDTEPRRSNSTR